MNNHLLDNSEASILVVDDTPANLRLLVDLLGEQGYDVRPALNGHRALLSAAAKPPDLILLDVMMPDMNGYEVCQRLKADERTRDIPIIFISALDHVLDKVKAFSIGGVDYVAKPFQVEEVLARVQTHLTIRHLQKKQQRLNSQLEELVQARTAELMATNYRLIKEIRTRQRAEMAVIEERQRLARELHDSVTQSLYSLRLLTNGWQTMAEQGLLNMSQVPDCFKQLGDVGKQALKEMRLLLHQLRSPLLSEMGLVGALQHRLEAVEQRASIETRLLTDGDVDNLPPKVEEHLFYIAQEALNNSLRHANATAVRICIRTKKDGLVLKVQDDGCGFDSTNNSAGMGLLTMRERAQLIGGQLSITSAPRRGTTVEIRVKEWQNLKLASVKKK